MRRGMQQGPAVRLEKGETFSSLKKLGKSANKFLIAIGIAAMLIIITCSGAL